MFQLNLGDGLELRLLREHHAAMVFQATERNRALLRLWLPWVDRSHSEEPILHFIRASVDQYEKREALNAGIFAGDALIGAIGLHQIDALNHNTSIGYWLDAANHGTGIMTRACRALITHAFTEYQLHRLEIRCATANTRSCAIPQRLGFVREGVLREVQLVAGRYLDLVIWGMLAQDWNP